MAARAHHGQGEDQQLSALAGRARASGDKGLGTRDSAPELAAIVLNRPAYAGRFFVRPCPPRSKPPHDVSSVPRSVSEPSGTRRTVEPAPVEPVEPYEP